MAIMRPAATRIRLQQFLKSNLVSWASTSRFPKLEIRGLWAWTFGGASWFSIYWFRSLGGLGVCNDWLRGLGYSILESPSSVYRAWVLRMFGSRVCLVLGFVVYGSEMTVDQVLIRTNEVLTMP